MSGAAGFIVATPIIKLSAPEAQGYWEIPVLFEDEHLLALNKPASLLTSPDRYDPDRPNLMKLLHRGIADAKPWAKERGLIYLANAHRLDFQTTGVILLAKNKPVLVELADAFGSGKPVKTYVALTKGTPAQDEFEIDAPIGPHPRRLGLMSVQLKSGKKSVTRVKIVEKFRGYTLVRCQPLTGRTHQIRVHLRWEKLTIMGDTEYGGNPLLLSELKRSYRVGKGKEERPLISTVALHAEELSLPHPVTDQPLSIKAAWPKDLDVAIKYLRRYAT